MYLFCFSYKLEIWNVEEWVVFYMIYIECRQRFLSSEEVSSLPCTPLLEEKINKQYVGVFFYFLLYFLFDQEFFNIILHSKFRILLQGPRMIYYYVNIIIIMWCFQEWCSFNRYCAYNRGCSVVIFDVFLFLGALVLYILYFLVLVCALCAVEAALVC